MAASSSPLMTTFTTVQLILIVLIAALVVAGMIWGARAKRRRKAQLAEIDTVEAGTPAAQDDQAPSPPATVGASPPPPAMTAAPPPPGEDDAAKVADPDAPATAGAPAAAPDDLTLLKGLGPRVAARLGELGVTRFADLAVLSPADADALDAQLGPFAGRLTRDRWVEQAHYLAAGDRAGFEGAFGRLG